MKPFLKWAGGKRQLLDIIKKYLPVNYNTYFEPFLGAGALLLELKPRKAVVGDINKPLINLWNNVKNNVYDIILAYDWYEATSCNKDKYLTIREEFNLLRHEDNFAVAAAMLWLNKHCFNGLWRVNKNGNFNTPWNHLLKPVELDHRNLQSVSLFLKRVDISHRTYQETCASVKKGDFIYFDPPYDIISDTANFTAYTSEDFGKKEQEELAAFYKSLTGKGVYVMLSNNDTPFIRDLYKDYTIIPLTVKRNINSKGNKRNSTEVIIINYN